MHSNKEKSERKRGKIWPLSVSREGTRLQVWAKTTEKLCGGRGKGEKGYRMANSTISPPHTYISSDFPLSCVLFGVILGDGRLRMNGKWERGSMQGCGYLQRVGREWWGTVNGHGKSIGGDRRLWIHRKIQLETMESCAGPWKVHWRQWVPIKTRQEAANVREKLTRADRRLWRVNCRQIKKLGDCEKSIRD